LRGTRVLPVSLLSPVLAGAEPSLGSPAVAGFCRIKLGPERLALGCFSLFIFSRED